MGKGIGFAVTGTGALLVWSGVRGFSILKAAQNITLGKPAATGQAASLLATDTGTGGGGGGTSSGLANAALKYAGHAYVFGGAPGPDGKNPWDCSSFVSYVIGHDMGWPVPGGAWAAVTGNGASHGPATVSYLAWSGAETIGHNASVAQAGDLCVWQTHMGIAIGGGKMISARDPAEGTGIDSIAGDIPGEVLFVRRIIIGNPHA